MKKKEKLKDIKIDLHITSNPSDFALNFGALNINTLMNGGINNGDNSTADIIYGLGKGTLTPHGSDFSVRTNYGDNDNWYTDGVYYKDLGVILYPKSITN